MPSAEHAIRTPLYRILIAEDIEANQVLARRALEAAGYAVTIADNGAKAVELFGREHFDLVLMDLQMPVMDGFEATEKIRASETDRRTPIVAFSALSADEQRRECIERGMNDFVHKPFEEKSLLRAIRKWVDQRPAVLIVDDSKESRVLIENHIRKLKQYRIAVAANGVEAIRAVRDQHIALVLMDMEMPVMDGYTAARMIAGRGVGPHIPIVAMTAHAGGIEIERCIKAGCADYIQKPVEKKVLLSVINKHVLTPEKEKGQGAGGEFVEVNPDLEELIPRYLENRRKDVETIAGLLDSGDLDEIRRLGHSMSGSGGGYGFQKISRLGRELENAAKENNLLQIQRANRRLSDYLENIHIAVKTEE